MTNANFLDEHAGRHRADDWITSIEGAKSVAYRAGSQKEKLLNAYINAYPNDLTDEEAAINAGISLTSEFSKRCGELRQAGNIVVVYPIEGVPLTRPGKAGVPRIVSILAKP